MSAHTFEDAERALGKAAKAATVGVQGVSVAVIAQPKKHRRQAAVRIAIAGGDWRVALINRDEWLDAADLEALAADRIEDAIQGLALGRLDWPDRFETGRGA